MGGSNCYSLLHRKPILDTYSSQQNSIWADIWQETGSLLSICVWCFMLPYKMTVKIWECYKLKLVLDYVLVMLQIVRDTESTTNKPDKSWKPFTSHSLSWLSIWLLYTSVQDPRLNFCLLNHSVQVLYRIPLLHVPYVPPTSEHLKI